MSQILGKKAKTYKNPEFTFKKLLKAKIPEFTLLEKCNFKKLLTAYKLQLTRYITC